MTTTTQPTTQPTFAQEIEGAVLRHYLDTGSAIDVPSLAAALGCSQTRLRNVLRENHGSVPGTEASRHDRPRYSKSYRSMQVGTSQVWMYEPTKAALRAAFLKLTACATSLALHTASGSR